MTAASQEYSLHAFLLNCDFYRHAVWLSCHKHHLHFYLFVFTLVYTKYLLGI